jgi:hypothetical protein
MHMVCFFCLDTCLRITMWPQPATHLMQGSCRRVLTHTAFKPSHETLIVMRVLAHTAANKPNLVSDS